MDKDRALTKNILGFNIIESYKMTESKQYKFPRKKNNIRWKKKYQKKYSVELPRKDFIISENQEWIICHPIMAERLRDVKIDFFRYNRFL